MTQIAIVGNGPSRELYRPFKGEVCLCNVPQLRVPYDYVSVVDRRAIDYIINNDVTTNAPILTTPQLRDEIRNKKHNNTIQPLFKEKLMNSAQTAAYHFSQSHDVIWLFGCDSLWSEVTTSHQDVLIPRNPRASNLHTRWRDHWKRVWATGKTFVIVCPKDAKPQEYGENVKWNHSKV